MPKLVFSPAEIGELTGWVPDAQRDLRHKEFLSNYGFQTESGRWKYTVRDLVAFWTATHLRDSGMPLHQLLATCWTNAQHVMNFMNDETYTGARYVAFLYNSEMSVDQMSSVGWEVVKVAELGHLELFHKFSKADLIDLKTVAAAVPETIRLWANAEIAGARV